MKKEVKKFEYHPEKFTEKYIASKLFFIFIPIILFCTTFAIMFLIAIKKVMASLLVMFSCSRGFNISGVKLFLVGFLIILLFILLLTTILYLLNLIFGIKITYKQALAIVISSYIYFTVGSILSSILFLVGWGYLGYILLIAVFFLTQFNVYKTYYSVVESHGKRFSIIITIIYIVTSIIIFGILNVTLFNYIKTLYTSFC